MALSGRELYGLEIITAVADASDGKRKIGFGSLYPTLHKLEKKGLVTPPTMLRTFLLGRMSVWVRTNPKHNRHFLFVNFYAPD